MKTKPVPKRLTKKQRAHLREMGIPCTIKAIKERVSFMENLVINDDTDLYHSIFQVCPDCADIAYRLGIK